jgi:hypothetical protein
VSTKTKTTKDAPAVEPQSGDSWYAGEPADPINDDRPAGEQPGTPEHVGSDTHETPYAGGIDSVWEPK